MSRLGSSCGQKKVQIVLREFALVLEGGLFLCVGVFQHLAETS
jgi:hypothetical protein